MNRIRKHIKMALKIACMMCHNELQEPGAIVLSSPNKKGFCVKHHICVDCEKILDEFLIDKFMTSIGFKKRKNSEG
jgi:hypothetical protein